MLGIRANRGHILPQCLNYARTGGQSQTPRRLRLRLIPQHKPNTTPRPKESEPVPTESDHEFQRAKRSSPRSLSSLRYGQAAKSDSLPSGNCVVLFCSTFTDARCTAKRRQIVAQREPRTISNTRSDSKTRRGKPPDPQRRDSASLHSALISRQKTSSRQSRPQCLLSRPGMYIHYRIKIFFQYLRDAQCRNVRIYPI